LDKISDTHKGEEIVHLLTHLTDPSQNTLFQDNYFPGIHLNLSKALFIFSFNDETKVDRILKDRMYVINTKGFNPKEKVNISRSYLLPELLDTFLFSEEEILFSDDAILHIIEKYTGKEEGVRNLKRCLETIISKINIYYLSDKKNEKEENTDKIPMTFKIKDFQLPLNITEEVVKELLPDGNNNGNPPEHMYM
jgi:ATP-dependent Lon protease